MAKISDAPSGEKTSADGTEKLPISGSQWMLVSRVADYIRTLTQTMTNKTLTTPTIGDFTNSQHNHSNAAGGGAISTTILNAGTYTPTRSAEANLDANVTMSEAQWMRVLNTVTVSGRFTADPTAAGTTSFEITLPVAANIGAAEDVAGVAFCGAIAGQGAEISGVAANDTAKIQWIAVDVTSQTWSFTFTYQVI